jgi:4-amino-4-deoxy-L-arabinose transferase-like glycosyltransferase
MPISALNAIPGKLADWLPEGQLRTFLAAATTGRYVTILFAMLAALVVYLWTRALYGVVPALFVLFLYVLEPNLLAHSQFVTTDVFAAGTILFALYALWRYARRPSWRRALVFASLLGLAQLAKYTAIFLYPLAALLLLASDFPQLRSYLQQRAATALLRYGRRLLGLAALVILVSLVVINLGFLFNRTLTPLEEYPFQSELFQNMQQLPVLKELPVPVPYPYLEGLDLVRFRERSGFGFGKIYLLGELRSQEGFPGYYLVAWLYKVPLAIQLILAAALLVYVRRIRERDFWRNELFLLGPILFFTLYFNIFYRAQIGIRYFLVVFPLLLILCGNLLVGWEQYSRRRWVLVGVLSVYLVLSVFRYYPHFIPYFNELVLDRRQAYTILADSNLEWGQAGWYIDRYLEEHPGAVLEPGKKTAGTLLLSPNSLLGISNKPSTYAWLRENYQPVGTIAFSYLIFEVPEEDLR